MARNSSWLLHMALGLVVACAPSGDAGEDTASETPAEEPAASAGEGMDAVLPEPGSEAVWAYLEGEDYRSTFLLWPEKGELYQGQEPHGALLTTYLNSTAARALGHGAPMLPNGSIIVKENYMPDGTFAAATVMYKVDGYDADNNDWWWMKRLADGTVEAEGQAAGCINCHGGQRANDFIWTSQLGG